MRNSFKFYSDPGHGWLAVKRSELNELGIIELVTRCSYQNGNSVYLEEDCDAPLFLNAYEAKFGRRPALIEKIVNKRSSIRSYEFFDKNSQYMGMIKTEFIADSLLKVN